MVGRDQEQRPTSVDQLAPSPSARQLAELLRMPPSIVDELGELVVSSTSSPA
jgi:hypothetical protein